MDSIKVNLKNVKMVAHRGLSGIERENTYPAFVAAGNRSYFGIETDVHVTADGKIVVIHDETTERVSGGAINVNVEESSSEDLKNIILPDLDGSTVRRDICLPFLSDYIRICKKYEKKCVLEIKNRFEYEYLEKVVEEINDFDYIENVIFISFDFDNCADLRKIVPGSEIQWLTSNPVGDKEIKLLKEHNLDLDIYYKQLSSETVDVLHRNGIKVNCWTCDNADEAKELAEMGVDYITSNILE